jgi:hypothetical protein
VRVHVRAHPCACACLRTRACAGGGPCIGSADRCEQCDADERALNDRRADESRRAAAPAAHALARARAQTRTITRNHPRTRTHAPTRTLTTRRRVSSLPAADGFAFTARARARARVCECARVNVRARACVDGADGARRRINENDSTAIRPGHAWFLIDKAWLTRWHQFVSAVSEYPRRPLRLPGPNRRPRARGEPTFVCGRCRRGGAQW